MSDASQQTRTQPLERLPDGNASDSGSSDGKAADGNLKVDLGLDARYVIQSELGRGAMGVVFKAHDRLIGRTVALKTIAIDTSADRNATAESLVLEAKAAGSLDHPNIITIYDVVLERGFIYLSMQFVEGCTLAALLQSRTVLSLSSLLSYSDQICQGVGFAHQRGVIHRDLKPSNLMLAKQGNIKVLDFGVARLSNFRTDETSSIAGTPCYMAPEQAAGREVDHRSDIFSLGVVFYELFTGKKPFTGEVEDVLRKVRTENPVPPSTFRPSMPGGIEAIIMKAMAKDPLQRFQDCALMAAAFRKEAKLLQAAPQIRAIAAKRTMTSASASNIKEKAVADVSSQVWAAPNPARRSLGLWKAAVGTGLCVLAIAAALAAGLWPRVKAWSTAAPKLPAPSTTETADQQLAAIERLAQPSDTAAANTTPPAVPESAPATETDPATVHVTKTDGAMEIFSTPSGATVEIEGTSGHFGETPLRIDTLAPAVYKVRLRKRGYAAESRSIEVTAGKRSAVAVQLTAIQGFLTVTSTPSGASIWIAGKDTGKVTPAQFTLDPGEHSIMLHKDAYLDESIKIQLAAGANASYTPNLRAAGRTDNIKTVGGFSKMFGGGPGREMAQIEIKSEPKGARITINGKTLDKTTPVVIQVEAGNYDLVLDKDGYQPSTQSVTAGPQDRIKIKETLSK